MIKLELTKDSSQLDDKVFAIVRKLKRSRSGRYYQVTGQTADAFEIVEAVISEIRYTWDFETKANAWTCVLATAEVDEGSLGRIIQNVYASDCFQTRDAAEAALTARFDHQ